MQRRSFLAGVGAVAVGSVVAGRFRSEREGRVLWGRMAADTEAADTEQRIDALIVLNEALTIDGSVNHDIEALTDHGSVSRDIHPDYRDAFDDGAHVSEALHRRISRQPGVSEPYYFVRYRAYDYNGIPGDEGGGAVEVSRAEFNEIELGDCVKM